MRRSRSLTTLTAVLFLLAVGSTIPASAQYFGRNKVQYDDFDFKTFRTDHFKIFYYPE